jgi:hypothetical protein
MRLGSCDKRYYRGSPFDTDERVNVSYCKRMYFNYNERVLSNIYSNIGRRFSSNSFDLSDP